MDKLKDKRVAVIGTGATGVQCIPQVARTAGHLFVFQRTPSSVDVRGNHPIDPEWFASIAKPGWQKRWMDNFVENLGPGLPSEDLIDDGWTAISRRIREKVLDGRPMWAAKLAARVLGALGRPPRRLSERLQIVMRCDGHVEVGQRRTGSGLSPSSLPEDW
jgi:cyclohexanone monooxygenase